ncbi:MAG: 1-acyl-sn-glycerol-3-phosphate acyltransferase [Gammaproteobacteria bacterium]|nr:1-acyl-sn-glycerol-3-phosphate acyltransferase [Gammaproteobacteria bacterium]
MRQLILFLRAVLFYLGYYLGTIVITLVCFIVIWFIPDSKRYLFYSVWCRFILSWLRITCGVRHEIQGLDNIPDQAVVVLSNHQSEWETIFLYLYLAPICPILKKELLNIPFWGWAMSLQHPIAIDRTKPHEAGKSILTQGMDRIKNGRSVIIFPEGTRTHVDKVKKFTRGGAKLAIAAGAPILPIAHNAGHCWPPHKMLKYPGTVQVYVGKPIATDSADAKELTESVETWIRQHIV